MRFQNWISGLWIVICLSTCGMLQAAGTVDRDYGLGDDSFEGAVEGQGVGIGNGFGTTFDSAGTPLFGDLQDLDVFNGPIYANVSDRPFYGSGLGVSFDGTDDYLRGANLNRPETSAASVNHLPPGPLDYVGIVDRSLQAWVKPNAASQAVTQSVVLDSNQHGVQIVDRKWSMRYAGDDFDSGIPVSFDQWTHVMVVRPFGPSGGSQLYVDGVVAAFAADGYDGEAMEELVVGSNTSRDENEVFTGGTSEFYHGLMDDLTLSVYGTSSGGQDWGDFEFAVDNDFAANTIGGFDVADVNLDGTVSGDGSGPAATDDVRAFVDGWLFEQEFNGVSVGDLHTRGKGDLNFSGRTDLLDWAILNAADPALGAAAANLLFVPEPATWTLLSGLICLLLAGRKLQ